MDHYARCSAQLKQRFNDLIEEEEKNDDLSSEERQTRMLYSRFIDHLIQDSLHSRLAITGNQFVDPEKALQDADSELIEYFLDRHLTEQALDSISGQVNRVLQLSRLAALHIPSHTTTVYLKEASRTYIMGLAQASVALSRAALEQALKEKLTLQGTGIVIGFQALLRKAREQGVIIDDPMKIWADEISKAGNDVMHEKPTTLPDAFDVLCKLRGALQHIYSSV